MFIDFDAACFPSSVRSDIRRMSLLTELKNKCALKTINMPLLTELKASWFKSFVNCRLHDRKSSGHYSDGDQ